MAKAALLLAFIAGAINAYTEILIEHGLFVDIRFLMMILYLPAVLLGMVSWIKIKSFSRSWPVIVCVLLSLAGIAWVEETEHGRAMLCFAMIAITLPISALIIKHNCWDFCAKTFIVASMFGLALTFLRSSYTNFGTLIGDAGAAVTNRNNIGFQFAFTALLLMSLRRTRSEHKRIGFLSAILVGLFVLAVILTGSRGATITLFVCVLLFLGTFSGTRSSQISFQRMHRFEAIMLFSATIGVFIIVFSLVTGFDPLEKIRARLFQGENVASLGDRTTIWRAGLKDLCATHQYFLRGVGTGGTDLFLSRALPGSGRVHVRDGILRTSSHNGFLEWIFCLGLIGAVAGAWLVLAAIRRTFFLDFRDGTNQRKLFMLFYLCMSCSAVTYRSTFAVALGSLLLAMLSGQLGFREASPTDRLLSYNGNQSGFKRTVWSHSIH